MEEETDKPVNGQNGITKPILELNTVKNIRRRPNYPTYRCDLCGTHPIKAKRWECDICDDFDVCNPCYVAKVLGGLTDHERSHTFSMFIVEKTALKVDTTIGFNWKFCPFSIRRQNDNTKLSSIDVLKGYLEECGVICPHASRWQNSTLIKILVAYEEGLYEYHQSSSTPETEIPKPIKRSILLTAIAFTGTNFMPSFNHCFEKIKHVEATKITMLALLTAVTKIFIWYESMPVPYSSGTPVYSTWRDQKKLEALFKDLKNDSFWKKAEAKASRDNANEKARKLFVLYFEEIANIWNEMSILSPKSTLITKVAKNHLAASIKTSCYIGFLFRTIIFRIRNYGMSYMWDVDFLKRKGVTPTMFTEVFRDFEGPFEADVEEQKKIRARAKLKEKSNKVKLSKKRKAVESIQENELMTKLEHKKFRRKSGEDVELVERERAKFKTLEAKVGIISHALTIALEKLEKLTAFVETIANRVTS